jgi:hypothetical protein
VTIVNYGVALGAKVAERFAIGGGVSLYTFNLESQFARFSFVSDVFSPADRNVVVATAAQHGDGLAAGANAGVSWVLAKGVKIGAQFRRGPRFAFTQRDVIPIDGIDLTRSGHFKVPDVAGAGLEWRPGDRQSCEPPPGESGPPHVWCAMRVLIDYDRVQYGQLKDDFIAIQSLSTSREAQLRIDNGNEVHGGVEYVFVNAPKSPALRLGAWFDPDHAVHYDATPANDTTDILLRATLPGGPNLVHYTFGGGLAISRRLELNAAADVSKRTTYLTASGVVRF